MRAAIIAFGRVTALAIWLCGSAGRAQEPPPAGAPPPPAETPPPGAETPPPAPPEPAPPETPPPEAQPAPPVETPTPPAAAAPAEEPKVKLKAGGFVTAAVNFDTNDRASRPWLNRVEGDNDDSVLLFDPVGTRLNLGLEGQRGQLTGKALIEVDFKGNGTTDFYPRIRHAYAAVESDVVDVLVGQTWTLIGMHGPTTFNWDWLFFQGNAYNRVPQLRLSKRMGGVTASVAGFLNSAANGSRAVIVDSSLMGTGGVGDAATPIAQARLELKVGAKGFIAVAGAAGKTRITFTGAGMPPAPSFRDDIGVGMATLDASIPIQNFKVSGKVWWSRSGGYNSVVGQMAVLTASQQAEAINSYGGFIDLMGQFGRAQLSLYAGLDDPEDSVEGIPIRLSRNVTVGGTAAYELVSQLLMGVEIQYAGTQVTTGAALDQTTFSDVRFSLVMQYKL